MAFKITQVTKSPSKFKQFADDIKVDSTSSEEEIKLSYQYEVYKHDMEIKPLVQLSQLKNYAKDDVVSVCVYLNVKNRPVVPVSLPYAVEPVDKKDVLANDLTGAILLSLWGSKINDVPENGTYDCKNVIIKLLKGALVLSTNQKSLISKASVNVEPSSLIPNELKTYTAQLPAINVQNVTRKYFCTKCKKFTESICHNPIIFSCSDCKSSSITARMKKKVEAHIEIELPDDSIVKVKIFGPQVEQYFGRQNRLVPTDLNELAIEFLQDVHTTLVYDGRNICIGFQ